MTFLFLCRRKKAAAIVVGLIMPLIFVVIRADSGRYWLTWGSKSPDHWTLSLALWEDHLVVSVDHYVPRNTWPGLGRFRDHTNWDARFGPISLKCIDIDTFSGEARRRVFQISLWLACCLGILVAIWPMIWCYLLSANERTGFEVTRSKDHRDPSSN